MRSPRFLAPALIVLLGSVGAAATPERDDALRARLRAPLDAGDWQSVLEIADAEIAREAESVLAWQYRAYSLHRMGDATRAGEAYEKTVALDPGNWWALRNLAELRADEGRNDDALAAARRAVALRGGSRDVRETLSRVLRARGEYAEAAAAADEALEAGVDPAWCHAELGYLLWVLGQGKESRDHWEKARAGGADDEACDHGISLVEWDRPRGSSRQREEVANRRRGAGPEWVFRIGGIVVMTRVGPRLPREIEKLLDRFQKGGAKLLGIEEIPETAVTLHVSRTLEEHEAHRRREFPEGYRGKAFLVQGRGRGRGRWGGPPRRGLGVYVAWSEPGLVRSLSHELTHVLLRVRTPRGRNMPVWFDEGLATYLELAPDEHGRDESGTRRADLLDTFSAAEAKGETLPFVLMLDAQRDAFRGANARARYAQAWTMVHFLLEGNGPGAGRKLRRYLDAIDSRGMTRASSVFGEIYGEDLEAIGREWAEHVEDLRK